MAEITKCIAPIAFEAFEDYILKSEKFSRLEMNVLKTLLNKKDFSDDELLQFGLGKREAEEFREKMKRVTR
ncbi:MAG: hypothetical protein FJ218_06465 [Ignavibacteria bacterium]|nr:hypothetical protein [Ignavibacteria bacterium]